MAFDPTNLFQHRISFPAFASVPSIWLSKPAMCYLHAPLSPFNSSVWQLILHNMVKLLPQRATKAWIQLPGRATDSSQQGHLAWLTVSMVVCIWDWADKGISFQVEKNKLYLYADHFLFVGFSITGWISGLPLQDSPTTWNIFTIVRVGDVLPAAGEMPQHSWLRRAGVEGHDRASLLCVFYNKVSQATTPA